MAAPKPSAVDARLQVLLALLEPAARVARVLGISLDDLQDLIAVAYFRELRARGLSLRQTAAALRKSLRTTASLSGRAREDVLPLEGSRRIGWRRDIVRELARRGPLAMDDVVRLIPDGRRAEVRAEVGQLLEEGLLSSEGGALSVAASYMNLVSDDFDHRVDSLRHFLSTVAELVYRRFFGAGGSTGSFARVLTFSALRKELEEVQERTYVHLKECAVRADTRADGHGEAVQASAALCFVELAPDPRWRQRPR